MQGVDALGVDEHVWSHTGPPGTGMFNGIVHARLLDLVPGRSGKSYADWLKARGEEFTAGIKTAALDPFRGYANAIRDELPEAITVLDAFHVVKLGPRWLTRSAAAFSRTPWATGAGRVIRSTGSAEPCRSAPNT